MKIYSQKTTGAIFCAFNATFDYGFIHEAFRKTKIKDRMDYYRLDLLSIAWEKRMKEKTSWNLKKTCEVFDIQPEPDPHSALIGAMTDYKLFKKIESTI